MRLMQDRSHSIIYSEFLYTEVLNLFIDYLINRMKKPKSCFGN